MFTFIRRCPLALRSAALALACASSAHAQGNAPGPAPALSRAEVIADLMVWRASGLQAVHSQGDGWVDPGSPAYRAATARYAALLKSARFAALVRQLESGTLTKAVLDAD